MEILSVLSLFFKLTELGVYKVVCVCIRTYTHTWHVGYSDVSSGVRERDTWEGPRNHLDGLNLGIHVFVYVYRVPLCTEYPCVYIC